MLNLESNSECLNTIKDIVINQKTTRVQKDNIIK